MNFQYRNDVLWGGDRLVSVVVMVFIVTNPLDFFVDALHSFMPHENNTAIVEPDNV